MPARDLIEIVCQLPESTVLQMETRQAQLSLAGFREQRTEPGAPLSCSLTLSLLFSRVVRLPRPLCSGSLPPYLHFSYALSLACSCSLVSCCMQIVSICTGELCSEQIDAMALHELIHEVNIRGLSLPSKVFVGSLRTLLKSTLPLKGKRIRLRVNSLYLLCSLYQLQI